MVFVSESRVLPWNSRRYQPGFTCSKYRDFTGASETWCYSADETAYNAETRVIGQEIDRTTTGIGERRRGKCLVCFELALHEEVSTFLRSRKDAVNIKYAFFFQTQKAAAQELLKRTDALTSEVNSMENEVEQKNIQSARLEEILEKVSVPL